jgi:dTDP-4-dehydrorhamnose reductase
VKVFVLGSKGMLGTAVMDVCRRGGLSVAGMDRDEVDATQYEDLQQKWTPCDWVINCAAYTNVDLAETEREAAHAVNGNAPGHMAKLCALNGARLLHISTDYVFDGSARRPYQEDDAPNPVNYYGVTKLEGERAVQSGGAPYIIVRTQSLFGVNGRNFIQAILRRLDAGEILRVVNDQTSCPTYVPHLAEALRRLLRQPHTGVVNVSATGSCTWFDFACAIAERVGARNEIRPVPAAEYKTPARRPPFSVLDNGRFTEWTGYQMPDWKAGLQAYLKEIGRVP